MVNNLDYLGKNDQPVSLYACADSKEETKIGREFMSLPEYLKQGEAARLFPVLSETSKEGRTTSIVLACIAAVKEFGSEMMISLGQRVGARTTIQAYTEIVMKDQKIQLKDRPDGLLVLSNGSKEWRVLVEAKIGAAVLDPEQVERYRLIAKEHGIDGVVTILRVLRKPNLMS